MAYKNGVIDRLTHKHIDTGSLNLYCLITGIVHINESIGLISGIGALMEFIGNLAGLVLMISIGYFIFFLGAIINIISPVVVLSLIKPSNGNIITIGLLGIKKETITSSDYNYIALYTGIKITGIFSNETFLLGFARDVQ